MKNKLTVTFYSFLLPICISLLVCNNVNAQENGIYELNKNDAFSKEVSKKAKGSDRENFYDLANKLHPTAYIENKIVNKANCSIRVSKLIFNDTNSFDLLNNSDFNGVELITINLKSIENLNNKIDLSDVGGLGNLKYVYIKCSFKCLETQIKAFIKSESNIRIFYKIEIPS